MPDFVEMRTAKIQISPGPEVIKLFHNSTQPSTKLILLIHVKIPTINNDLQQDTSSFDGILVL